MTASAESGSLEFGSVFARRSPSAVNSGSKHRLRQPNSTSRRPRRLRQAGSLRGVGLVPKQDARPARRKSLLHVDVRLLHVASALQDLGVEAVTPEQPLIHPETCQLADGEAELPV